jgi:peptidoglycan/LPS O-acetylase OafA/YrhL
MITSVGSLSSVHLDLVRGLAAVAVFAGHLRGIFLVDFQQIKQPGLFLKLLYLVTGFGHQAVMIFFVLSGFFITSSISRSWSRWSWSCYLTDRLVRLYLVLLPGLFLTVLWDWLGRTFGAREVYEGGFPGTVMAYSAIDRCDTATFVANAAFLQTVVAPPFGTNGPLWSIANEFWYYMLFPAIALAFAGNCSLWIRGLYAISIVGILFFLGPQIGIYFLVWLMGAAVRFIPPLFRPESQVRVIAVVATALATLLILLFSRLKPGLLNYDFSVALAFAAWMYCTLHNQQRASANWYSAFSTRLAGFSFSLYVLHFPVLMAIYAMVVARSDRWTPDAKHLLAATVIGLGVLAYAMVMSRLTEDNTGKVRRLFRGRTMLMAEA